MSKSKKKNPEERKVEEFAYTIRDEHDEEIPQVDAPPLVLHVEQVIVEGWPPFAVRIPKDEFTLEREAEEITKKIEELERRKPRTGVVARKVE